MRARVERKSVFHLAFRQDLAYWIKTEYKTALRIMDLVEAAMRDPFIGIGKPEPLKYQLAGAWSRRIGHHHRLVYRVGDSEIVFLEARYHY